jgi:hypothetical protein
LTLGRRRSGAGAVFLFWKNSALGRERFHTGDPRDVLPSTTPRTRPELD